MFKYWGNKLAKRICCNIENIINYVLFIRYGFDSWHVRNGSQSRAYKKVIAEKITELKPTTVVEIGCGLGDILRQVRSTTRIGCDIDSDVIFAARTRALFLGIDYRVGDSTVVPETEIDVLIMVNWIHNVAPDALADLIDSFFLKIRYLVVDSIDGNSLLTYKYAHDFEFLSRQADLIDSFKIQGEPRTFLIWKRLG